MPGTQGKKEDRNFRGPGPAGHPVHISCLARSSQPKHISRMQGPDSIPSTLLNSRRSLRRFPSLGLVSYSIPGMRLAFAWATVPSRADVTLGLTCQRLLLQIQLRLRITMQHICGHAQNLGNECADHACALGTYGLSSNHNIRTRWTRSSFDSNSLFAQSDNLDDALQVLRNARTAHAPAPQRMVRHTWCAPCLSVVSCLRLRFFFFYLVNCAPFGSVNADALFSIGRWVRHLVYFHIFRFC